MCAHTYTLCRICTCVHAFYVYVCMYTCLRICVHKYVCVRICAFVYAYARVCCLCMCLNACVRTCNCACTRLCTHLHECVGICTCICTCMYACVCLFFNWGRLGTIVLCFLLVVWGRSAIASLGRNWCFYPPKFRVTIPWSNA